MQRMPRDAWGPPDGPGAGPHAAGGSPRSQHGPGCHGGAALPPTAGWAGGSPPRGSGASGCHGPPLRMRMSRARLYASPHADPPRPIVYGHPPFIGRYFGDQGASYVDAASSPHTGGPPRQPPGWPDRGHGLELGLWGGLRPLPDEPSTIRRDGMVVDRSQARHEGRTTSHHPTTHLLPPSCQRTWLPSWVRLPRAAHLTCWTTLLPATSGTPWKMQVAQYIRV